METRKVVIIGSGPAAWTAAIYAARGDLKPLVFEGAVTAANQAGGTLPLGQLALTTEVENYPAFPHVASDVLEAFSRTSLPPERFANLEHLYKGPQAPKGRRAVFGPEMMEYMRQQALNFGAEIRTEDVTSLDLGRRPFSLMASEGGKAEASALIVATGARANYLGLPSEERFKNKGVSACAVCDGALPRFRNRPLVVVGGGDSAVEEGTYLAKFASRVYVVHRRDSLRASKIMQKRLLSNPKIEMKWSSVVTEVLGTEEDGVTGVRLVAQTNGKTEELAASGMFCAIGHTPNTQFLGGRLVLDEKGYVVTDGRTRTSVPGVFAAGDVMDPHYRQAVTAAGTGCMAALEAERYLIYSTT